MSNELIVKPTLTPQIWDMLVNVGQSTADAKVFAVRAAEASIKALFCYENGMPLTAANTGLFIVNGKMAVQSNLIAAQIRKHPAYDYRLDVCDDKSAKVTILRKVGDDWQDEGAATFTIEEAKNAGLAGKDNWKGYPSDMLFARALTRAQRRYAPDIWGGSVYTPEEVGAQVDEHGDVVDGSWRTVAEPVKEIEAEKPVITLEMLVQKHGPAEILAANGGALPATAEEVETLAAKLDGPREI